MDGADRMRQEVKNPALAAGGDAIKQLAENAERLQQGRPAEHPELIAFSTEEWGERGDEIELAPDWGECAISYLQFAIAKIRADEDAIPDVSGALACLQIQAGEIEPDPDLLGDSEPPCICPPELRQRGGYTSTCRADHEPPESECRCPENVLYGTCGH